MIERIDSAIFGPVPTFTRLSIRLPRIDAADPRLSAASRERLDRAGRAAAATARPDDPRLTAWPFAYADVGLPDDTVPPHVALLAWARTPGGVPSQGAVPDLLNAIALERLLPTAGYDVAGIGGDLWLRPSRGCESFVPLGARSERPEVAPLNEVILADSAERVVARAWHGAPGAQAFPHAATRDLLVHIDLLPAEPVALDDLMPVAADAAGELSRILGGTASWGILARATPQARWDA